jgi:serine/threonine protein kinase
MDATLVSEDSNSRIQTLVCRASDGKMSRIRVLVEFKPYQLRRRSTVPPPIVVERVEKLAKLLGHAKAPDAGFRALLCIAVVPQAPQTRFAFAFELAESSFPLGNAPLDLQQAIKSKDGVRPTLGERFAMATTVAQTIFELHSVHWLHKSIRSDNVIFGQQSVPTDRFRAIYRKPFIIGFEFSREQGDRSTTEQDDRLERNIYRDPDRQGAPADSPRFTVLHDIYSLGVVLLEIGLWRLAYEFEDFSNSDADSIRRSLQDHARDRLPHHMGEDYTNAVLSCLNGTLVAPEVAKKLTLPDHKQQLLEVNMALSEKIIDQIARGVKGT